MGVVRVNVRHALFTNIYPHRGGNESPSQRGFSGRLPHVVHSSVHPSSTPLPMVVPMLSSSSSTASSDFFAIRLTRRITGL